MSGIWKIIAVGVILFIKPTLSPNKYVMIIVNVGSVFWNKSVMLSDNLGSETPWSKATYSAELSSLHFYISCADMCACMCACACVYLPRSSVVKLLVTLLPYRVNISLQRVN